MDLEKLRSILLKALNEVNDIPHGLDENKQFSIRAFNAQSVSELEEVASNLRESLMKVVSRLDRQVPHRRLEPIAMTVNEHLAPLE